MTGFFVAIEGPEAAGKSTLLRSVTARMVEDGVDPVVVREPGGTPVAEALRDELLAAERAWTPGRELLYLATARADLVTRVIQPTLDAGGTVLADRYDLSTIAYQVAGRGLAEEQVRWVNQAATDGLRPDVTLVLDIDPARARQRQELAGKGLDRFEREEPPFHLRVAAAYRSAVGTGVHHVDAVGAPDTVLAAAWGIIVAARPSVFRARDRQPVA